MVVCFSLMMWYGAFRGGSSSSFGIFSRATFSRPSNTRWASLMFPYREKSEREVEEHFLLLPPSCVSTSQFFFFFFVLLLFFLILLLCFLPLFAVLALSSCFLHLFFSFLLHPLAFSCFFTIPLGEAIGSLQDRSDSLRSSSAFQVPLVNWPENRNVILRFTQKRELVFRRKTFFVASQSCWPRSVWECHNFETAS